MPRKRFLLLCILTTAFAFAGCVTTGLPTSSLERKSLDELMALHMDDSARVHRGALYAVLWERLNELPTSELVRLRNEANLYEPPMSDPPPPRPLFEFITPETVLVHGRWVDVELDRGDVVSAILRRSSCGIDTHSKSDRVLFSQYPETPILQLVQASEVDPPVEKQSYIFIYYTWNDGIMDSPVAGASVYDGMVRDVLLDVNLNFNEAWEFLKAYHKQVSGERLDGTELADWQAKLNGSRKEALMALEVLAANTETRPDTSVLNEIVERERACLRDLDRYSEEARASFALASAASRMLNPEPVRNDADQRMREVREAQQRLRNRLQAAVDNAGEDPLALEAEVQNIGIDKVTSEVSYGRFAHVALVPVLRKAFHEQPSLMLLEALAECGAVDEATGLAVAALDAPVPLNKERTFSSGLSELSSYASFLTYHPSANAVPLLQKRLSARELRSLRVSADRFYASAKPHERYVRINRYEQDLTAALFCCQPSAAEAPLRRMLRTSDIDGCIVAAWALHALGDESVLPLVKPLADHELFYGGRISLSTIRSARTDALLISRLEEGLEYGDSSHLGLAFTEEYAEAVLPLILRYLEGSAIEPANVANDALRYILTPGAASSRLPASETERRAAIEEWKRLVAERLAK